MYAAKMGSEGADMYVAACALRWALWGLGGAWVGLGWGLGGAWVGLGWEREGGVHAAKMGSEGADMYVAASARRWAAWVGAGRGAGACRRDPWAARQGGGVKTGG
jgi:hypothetical protein